MMGAPLLHESWVVAALGLAVLSGVVGAMAGKAFGDIPLLTMPSASYRSGVSVRIHGEAG